MTPAGLWASTRFLADGLGCKLQVGSLKSPSSAKEDGTGVTVDAVTMSEERMN